MSNQQMVNYDYYRGYCVCPGKALYIGMRTTSNTETSSFPVEVFNINEVSLGTAVDKSDYIRIWNSDPYNQEKGRLSGGLGPFGFVITMNPESELLNYVFGNPLYIISLCPAITFSDITLTSFTATWLSVAGASKYLYKLTLVGDPEVIVQAETTELNHEFTGLTQNTNYHLNVYAYIAGAFVTSCSGANTITLSENEDIMSGLNEIIPFANPEDTPPDTSIDYIIEWTPSRKARFGDAAVIVADYLGYSSIEGEYLQLGGQAVPNQVPDTTFYTIRVNGPVSGRFIIT